MKRSTKALGIAVLAAAALGIAIPANASATPAKATWSGSTSSAATTSGWTTQIIRGGTKILTSKDRYGTFIVKISRSRPSAPLTPNSARGCVGNLPWNNVQTCFEIDGNGSYVSQMFVTGYVRNSTVVLAEALWSQAFGTFRWSPTYVVQPGEYNEAYWAPNANVPTGQYCGSSWEPNGDQVGNACETVK